jgi:hypothetical protein
MRLTAILTSLAAIACAAPAAAETSPFCGKAGTGSWPALAETLVGAWGIEHMAGWVEMGGMVLPFPADGQADKVSLVRTGEELIIDHPEAQEPMVLGPADEPRWAKADGAQPGTGENGKLLAPDDAALAVAGCDQLALPRLIGQNTLTSGGQKMDFTIRLMALDPNTLYGALQVDSLSNGVPVVARRAILLKRTEP